MASQEVDDQIFQVLAEKQQLLQEQVRNLAVPRSKWKMDLICQLFSEYTSEDIPQSHSAWGCPIAQTSWWFQVLQESYRFTHVHDIYMKLTKSLFLNTFPFLARS